MDWRNWNNNVVDVSSFMLFESTGDSEADSDLNMVANSLSDDNMGVTYEVDDALSCCSDSCESSVRDYNDDHDQEYAQFSNKKEQHYDYNPRYRDRNDDEEEEDKDDAIDQDWTSGKEGFVLARKKKSNVYEDSTMEPMKKEEKDKLFWETCLAS